VSWDKFENQNIFTTMKKGQGAAKIQMAIITLAINSVRPLHNVASEGKTRQKSAK